MPSPREIRRQERRKNRSQDPAGAAPAAPAPSFSAVWLVAIAAVGGAAIAGAVVFEMTRPDSKAEVRAPTGTVPVTMPTPIPSGATPTFVPQPPGEVPPGKVWSPEHGHWHDIAPAQPPR